MPRIDTVTDLLKEELTDEEQAALDTDTRRENYKQSQKYLLTPAFKKLCKKFMIEWKSMMSIIKQELKTREKTDAVKSEADKIAQDIAYYEKIKSALGNTKWEKVLKLALEVRIENAESNVYIKVDPSNLFDLPVYTKLDMLKLERNSLMTLEAYITWISELFQDAKEKETQSLMEEAWYEEMTDVS